MPHYSSTLEIARPLADMFSFFAKPRNLLQLAPPELSLELLTAPDVLILGSRLVWKGKRYGISQQITQDIATFDVDNLIVVEQKQGPFKRWIHAHQFLATEGGVDLRRSISNRRAACLDLYHCEFDSKDLESYSPFKERS